MKRNTYKTSLGNGKTRIRVVIEEEDTDLTCGNSIEFLTALAEGGKYHRLLLCGEHEFETMLIHKNNHLWVCELQAVIHDMPKA